MKSWKQVNPRIIFIIILHLFLLNMIFPVTNQEINKKMEEILTQDKYNYQLEAEKKDKQEHPVLSKIFNVLKIIFTAIFTFFKILRVILGHFFYPIALLMIIIFVLVMIWIIKKIRLSFNKKKKDLSDKKYKTQHFNFEMELITALEELNKGHHKNAISLALNALWLYLQFHKIIPYQNSRTNREYLARLKTGPLYESIKPIVYKAEKLVYHNASVNFKESNDIYQKIIFLIQK